MGVAGDAARLVLSDQTKLPKEKKGGVAGDIATCLRFKSYRRRRPWKKKKQLEEESEELV